VGDRPAPRPAAGTRPGGTARHRRRQPARQAAQREQIFSAFSQLEEEFTGNIAGIGLGLSTAQRLVESWGGAINYESALGQGARFFFTVPSEFSPPEEVPDAGR